MKKSLLADLTLLFVAFVWGATFVIVKTAVNILPPHSYNFLRFFFASIILFVLILIIDRKSLEQLSKKSLFAGIFLGVFLFLGYAFQTVGLLYTTSAKAGFITGLNVVLVPIFAVYIIKAKPKFTTIIGISVAAIGLFVMTMVGKSADFSLGDLLVFICAIFFALQIVYTGKYAPKYSPFMLSWIQVSVVAILSLLAAFLLEDTSLLIDPNIVFNNDVVFALVITAVLATAFAYLAQQMMQKFTSPTRVALIFTMEPVFAALTTIFVEDKMLSIHVTIGGILIFLGMIFSELPSKKQKMNTSPKSPNK